jgi:translation elongation factor EF-G
MMAIEVEVPEELTTAIQREIGAHRGRIESKLTANGFGEINAVVPLSELLASSSGDLPSFPWSSRAMKLCEITASQTKTAQA